MQTRRKQGRSQAEAEETRKLLEKSKEELSDFQSYSSSSGEYGDDVSDISDDGFVVQGQYADYESEKKETAKPKTRKGQEEKVQKTNLFDFLQKQANNSSKTKAKPAKAKSAKEQTNDDFGLQSILDQLNVDDDRKKKNTKTKQKPAAPVPAFLKKKESLPNDDSTSVKGIDIDDDETLPPPTNYEPQLQQYSRRAVVESIENDSANANDIPNTQPSDLSATTKNKKNARDERLIEFDLQPIAPESIELTAEEIKLLQKEDIEVPSDETMDLYMYNVHELNGKLYLFCKYKYKGRYVTVSVMVGQCFYYLQFLPIPGHEEDLVKEVEKVTHQAGFKIHKAPKYKDRRYSFDRINIPHFAKWYCVHLTPKGDLSKIPQQGNHYSDVFGITSSLTERFLLKNHIFGPTWIRVTEVKKFKQTTTCPMFTIMDISHVQVLPENQQPDEHVPPFNICTFALQNVIDKSSPQIVIAAMNILYYWNIETFTPCQVDKNSKKSSSKNSDKASMKSIVLICPKKNESLSTEYTRSVKPDGNVVICKNEADLLTKFVLELEKYDIDLISSFGLNSSDLPLIYEKLIAHKVPNMYLLGRIKMEMPKKGRFDVLNALAGRLPVDVRVSCMEFLKSKVNDLSAIVKEKFDVDRQNVENFDISKKLSSFNDLSILISFTQRDSILVKRLLQDIKVLSLTLQISKLSACPWSRVLLGASSPRCETLLLQNFFAEKFILPEKVSLRNETFKRESKYKGGKVLEPKRGFYDTCILVLDFNSLYPSIIREFNICFTTVNKENPDAYASKNNKTNGIVPRIMKELLEARNKIKVERSKLQTEANSLDNSTQKFKNIQDNIGRLNIKEKAIKLLANSIYGYLAYKGSRFQSQELAALITEQGRIILEDTVKTINNMCGSESAIIYGDTDSVMVNSTEQDIDRAKKKAKELSDAVSNKYRFLKLGIDYLFLKMLLVQKKKYAALVYKDPPQEPELKKSGLDMVRRDWSALTKNMSEFIINQFMKDRQDKDQAISTILNELRAVSAILHNGGKPIQMETEGGENEESIPQSIQYPNGIPITHLLINKALKNSVDKYQNSNKNPPHVAVALRMLEQGIKKSQGDTISYYIVKSDARDIGSKAKFKEEVNNDFSLIDVDWYLTNQLLNPLWRLCEPFGQMQLSEIANALGIHMQIPIDNTPTEYDDNPCYQIDHLTDLIFICRGCNQPIKMTTKYHDCLICQRSECGYQNNWKDVANQLTDFVRKFIADPRSKEKEYDITKLYRCDGYLCTYKTNQLPLSTKEPVHTNGYKRDHEICGGSITSIISSADIFNTLRYFKCIFEKPKKGPDDMIEFREYMYKIMNYFYQMHEFTQVNFTKMFNGKGIQDL